MKYNTEAFCLKFKAVCIFQTIKLLFNQLLSLHTCPTIFSSKTLFIIVHYANLVSDTTAYLNPLNCELLTSLLVLFITLWDYKGLSSDVFDDSCDYF